MMIHVSKQIQVLPTGQVISGPGTTYRANTSRSHMRRMRRKGLVSARQQRNGLKTINRTF